MNPPSFDTWTSLFLLAAAQGLFFSVVFAWRMRSQFVPFKWLILLCFLFSIALIDYVLFWTGYNKYVAPLAGFSLGFAFLYGPILWVYFRQVFDKQQFAIVDIIYLLPFIIYKISINWIFTTKGSTYPLFWLSVIHMLLYAIFIHWKYNSISRSDPAVYKWYLSLQRFFIGFIMSVASYLILVRLPFFRIEWDYAIGFCMTGFIYAMAWKGYLQSQVFGSESIENPLFIKQKNALLPENVGKSLELQLRNAMETQYLYRDSELRMEKLAKLLNAKKHHLSKVINERIGMSFFDYINHLRIEEAKHLLATTAKEEKNIIEIAYQVGFNNKVSFNTIFKKLTGTTPTHYRELHYQASDKKIPVVSSS